MFRNPGRITAAMLAGAVSLGAISVAQAQDAQNDDWVDLESWDEESVYKGWSADAMLDEDVYGANGDEIGEVEDFMIGPDGKIARVVVEGGGFLDIGDSHVAIPYDRMKRNRSDSFTAPLTEEELEDGHVGMFETVDDMPAKPQNWRVSNLIGDSMLLENRVGYGLVDDVIFGNDGAIKSVIVRPSYGYGYGLGPRAVPYANTFDPYQPYYSTPYTLAELEETERFNYGRLDEDNWEGEAFGEE